MPSTDCGPVPAKYEVRDVRMPPGAVYWLRNESGVTTEVM